MSFRRKLVLLFALTVFLSVATVAWIVSLATRRAFEQANEAQTAALVGQFQKEFRRRADDVAKRVEAIAASEATTRMALSLSRGISDAGSYLNEAGPIAESHQLDFRVRRCPGTIISSAQSPARFGYRDTSLPNLSQLSAKGAFLKQEDLSSGSRLGLVCGAVSSIGDAPLYRHRRAATRSKHL